MSDHIIDWEDVDQLKKLLVGRKIVKVKGDKLILDNAAVLDVVPNYGREMVDLIRGETLRNLKEKYGV